MFQYCASTNVVHNSPLFCLGKGAGDNKKKEKKAAAPAPAKKEKKEEAPAEEPQSKYSQGNPIKIK